MSWTILVADDDPHVLETYRQVLGDDSSSATDQLLGDFSILTEEEERPEVEGFDLQTVSSGEAAVTAVARALEQEQPFFLALLDVRMPPGIDGVEAAAQIRQLDPRIYIAIVTAYSDHDLGEISRRIGEGFLYLRKPFNREELLQVCRNFQTSWRYARESEHRMALMEELHEKERQNAWLVGSEEVSRMVLHNIGNALAMIENGSWELEQSITEMEKMPQLIEMVQQEVREADNYEAVVRLVNERSEQISDWFSTELYQVLRERGDRLRQVVHHVVEVMEIHRQGGKKEEPPAVVTLEALVHDALLVLESYARDRLIEIDTVGVETIPPLYWRRNHMLQAMVNLLKNGFESIEAETLRRQQQQDPDGLSPYQGWLRLQAMEIELPGEVPGVELVVEENGAGVDPAFRDRLFQYGNTTKERGSGIGLYWVRQEVESVGGTVVLESPGVGQGARVVLQLPVSLQ